MTLKYETELLFTETKTSYHVYYNSNECDEEDEEYIVVKTHKFYEDIWEIFPIDSKEKINKSSKLGKRLINFCKKL